MKAELLEHLRAYGTAPVKLVLTVVPDVIPISRQERLAAMNEFATAKAEELQDILAPLNGRVFLVSGFNILIEIPAHQADRLDLPWIKAIMLNQSITLLT